MHTHRICEIDLDGLSRARVGERRLPRVAALAEGLLVGGAHDGVDDAAEELEDVPAIWGKY